MEVVGQYLQQEAARRDAQERDLFGRSAFNRYYYATFLDVKQILGAMKPEWGTIVHSSVPEVLRGALQKELKQGRTRAQRSADAQTVELCNKAIAATSQLATLMEEGYATRVTADYYPNIKVDFGVVYDFQLNAVRVKVASDWPNKARILIRTVSSAWMQIHD